MKYLKKYNESQDNEELKESFTKISNECLAYLIDDGYQLCLSDSDLWRDKGNPKSKILGNKYTTIDFRINKPDFELFTWKDIKDDFIPFLELVSEKFKIVDQITNNEITKVSQPFIFYTSTGTYTLSLDNLINDKISEMSRIKWITFKINNYI
jgi:hypothetical protein